MINQLIKKFLFNDLQKCVTILTNDYKKIIILQFIYVKLMVETYLRHTVLISIDSQLNIFMTVFLGLFFLYLFFQLLKLFPPSIVRPRYHEFRHVPTKKNGRSEPGRILLRIKLNRPTTTYPRTKNVKTCDWV